MRKRILVVEYNNEVIEKINQFLHHDIFDVTVAGDATVARALLDNRSYDLVITASLLPKSHGFTLAKLITTDYPHTKVMVICDKIEDEQYQNEGYESGACELLEKPLKESHFRQRVMEHLGLSQDALFSNYQGDSTRIHVLPLLEEIQAVAIEKNKTSEDNFDDIIDKVGDDSGPFEIELD